MEEKEAKKLKDPAKVKDKEKDKEPKARKQDKKAEEILELKERLMRLQAEFENFKKRSRTELEDRSRYGTQELMTPLLSVVDNFERALAAKPEGEAAEAFANGVELIYRQLMEILGSQGLEKIQAKGEVFDPNLHQGVMNEPVEDEALVGKVTDEFQAGYTLNKRVIRHTMVKVGIKE